jgi:cellulose synthase/poly-beta-1,6-N-acetylglucosamine synthase-like glycosyltransferase
MAFQIHKKKLGHITHHPSVIANTQDPDNIKDYYNQIKRWNLGFFQTIKYWKVWPSFFWLSLGVFIIEMIIFSLFILLLPIITPLLIIYDFPAPFSPSLISMMWIIYIAIFLFDYIIALFIAWKDRTDILSLYSVGFVLMRYIDATVFLSTMPKAIFQKSTGVWISPTRR